jgi:sulfane dehydrogenase subunit SoxC
MIPDDPGRDGRRPITRRSLLGKTTAVMGGAAMGGLLAPMHALAEDGSNLPPHVPDWSRQQGAPVVAHPYGLPAEFEKNVVRRSVAGTPTDTAAASRTPLQDLHGIITPNGLVYERHHAGVPRIDPEQHRLILHGLVERPLVFTMSDLMRFPSVSRLHFLECSGNTQGWKPGSAGLTVQDTHGLLSCCEWTGVMLSTVLAEAGVKKMATWLLAESADAAGMDRSVPIAKALDDAMVVYSQNGERLRPEQGYPLRLFLPGYEGNMSVKWLRRIKLGAAPFETREETSKYTDLLANGQARQFTFLMEGKSVITQPSGGHVLTAPGFYEISGLAWSGHGKIRAVDVSTDGGASWHAARLQEPVLSKCLTRFRFAWRWDGGPALLQSRAVDETGYIQPTNPALVAARGTNSNYHYNGIHSWKLEPGGRVSNAA